MYGWIGAALETGPLIQKRYGTLLSLICYMQMGSIRCGSVHAAVPYSFQFSVSTLRGYTASGLLFPSSTQVGTNDDYDYISAWLMAK
jgi:hypothetical protein